MSNYESRLQALNLAREITAPGSSAEDLINAAYKIEQHLLGKTKADDPSIEFQSGIDFHGKPVTALPLGSEQTWSGTAQDLALLCNSDNTLICKARQVGGTTFLCEYAAEMSKMGKRVLVFAKTYHCLRDCERLVAEKGADKSLIDFQNINRFTDPQFSLAFRGRNYDIVIVDGLAYLPYSAETLFLATVMPLAKRFIFVSEPAQAQGLFYDLWQNSTSFQKVMLTWNTPLFPHTPERHKQIDALKANISDHRFRNEFQCEFRDIKDNSN